MRFTGVLFFSALLATLSLPAGAFAAPLELSVQPPETSLAIGDYQTFSIRVANTGPADKFVITLRGPHVEWLSQSYILLSMAPGQTKEIALGLYVSSRDIGAFPYTVEAESILFPDLRAMGGFDVTTFERFGINRITPAFTGKGLRVTLDLSSSEPRTEDVTIEVRDSADKIVSSLVVPQVHVDGARQLVQELPFGPGTPPGTYVVQAFATSTRGAAETAFTMPAVRRIERNVRVRENAAVQEIAVELVNAGNAKAPATFEQQYPAGAVVSGMAIAPSTCTAASGAQDCSFALGELAPGQSAQLSWRVEKWVTPVQAAIGGVIIVLSLALLGHLQLTPRIHKRARRKSKSRHALILEVRNPRGRTLRNVVVRDTVSPLAEVDAEAFESLKPVVRRHQGGTELIWNLGDMSPRETRMLSYKINTVVGGALRMPHARMRYVNHRNEKVIARSRRVTVE